MRKVLASLGVVVALGSSVAGMSSALAASAPSPADQYLTTQSFEADVSQYAVGHHQAHPYSLAAVRAAARKLPAGWRVGYGKTNSAGYLVSHSVTLGYGGKTYAAVYFPEQSVRRAAYAIRSSGTLHGTVAAERERALVERERIGLGFGVKGLQAASQELGRSFPGFSLGGIVDRGNGDIDGAITIVHGRTAVGKVYPAEKRLNDAKAALRDLATNEETLLTDTNSYGSIQTMMTNAQKVSAARGVRVAVVRFDAANGYCLSASYGADGRGYTYYWDSQAGGMLPKGTYGCTVTTAGTDGGWLDGAATPENEASSSFTYGTDTTPPPANQYDTAAKSDLRNLATNEETLVTDTKSYGTIASMTANNQTVRVSPGVTVTVAKYDAANGYCLTGNHRSSAHYFLFDSRSGLSSSTYPSNAAAAAACSLTNGTTGDSKTG